MKESINDDCENQNEAYLSFTTELSEKSEKSYKKLKKRVRLEKATTQFSIEAAKVRRYEPYFIHVQFYGKDFPSNLTSKMFGFVYRRRDNLK